MGTSHRSRTVTTSAPEHRDPEARLRDIAAGLGITERRAFTIVKELTEAGYVVKQRIGRCSFYEIQDASSFFALTQIH